MANQTSMKIMVGLTEVTITGDDQREIIEEAAFYQELPDQCPECQASLIFTARHPQSFNYYGMRCLGKPSHETTFGVKKEGGALFYKAKEPWTSWQGRPQEEESAPQKTGAAADFDGLGDDDSYDRDEAMGEQTRRAIYAEGRAKGMTDDAIRAFVYRVTKKEPGSQLSAGDGEIALEAIRRVAKVRK